MKGKFYGIGVGPGDPELLTLKAVRILSEADTIISPESLSGKGSMALEIAKRYLRKDVEIITLVFPMTYDKESLMEKCEENSGIIMELLEKDKNVSFLTLGDPMLYSTYIYILKVLKRHEVKAETIPGITSFCAAASRTGIPIAEGEESVGIVPLQKKGDNLSAPLELFDNIIVMKPSANSKLIAEKIMEKGLEDRFFIVSDCGTEKEEITRDLDKLKEGNLHYLSTVIIKKKGFI